MLSLSEISNHYAETETELHLCQQDLHWHSQEELLNQFSAIPEHISCVNLSWNDSSPKTSAELKELIAAIPPTVLYIDISGNSLHLKSKTEQIDILSSCAHTRTLISEQQCFNHFLFGLQLIKTIQQDYELGDAIKHRQGQKRPLQQYSIFAPEITAPAKEEETSAPSLKRSRGD